MGADTEAARFKLEWKDDDETDEDADEDADERCLRPGPETVRTLCIEEETEGVISMTRTGSESVGGIGVCAAAEDDEVVVFNSDVVDGDGDDDDDGSGVVESGEVVEVRRRAISSNKTRSSLPRVIRYRIIGRCLEGLLLSEAFLGEGSGELSDEARMEVC